MAIEKKRIIVRRRLMKTLYVQQYSADLGVYYDTIDPIVRSIKKGVFFYTNSKKLSIKSQLSTLI